MSSVNSITSLTRSHLKTLSEFGGGGGGDPPDRKPNDALNSAAADAGAQEALSFSAALMALMQAIQQILLGLYTYVTAQAMITPGLASTSQPAPIAQSGSFNATSPRYYAVFVGSQVGVFTEW